MMSYNIYYSNALVHEAKSFVQVVNLEQEWDHLQKNNGVITLQICISVKQFFDVSFN